MTASQFTASNPTAHASHGGYRGDLTLFMALAFALSWTSWFTAIGIGGSAMSAPTALPYLFGAFGPLLAALVIRVRRTRRGEPVPARAVRFHRKTLLWAPLLLALASATVLSAALLAYAAGDPAPSADKVREVLKDAGGPAAFLVSMVISGPLSEEPGWRGTAYPRMRASMGRSQVGLVLGLIWAVWHLPLFFINDTVQNDLGLATPGGALFAVSSVPMAMLIGYAYERAGVVAAVAVHFAANTTMVLVNVTTEVTLALIVGIQAIVVALLLATIRRTDDSAPGHPTAPSAPSQSTTTSAPGQATATHLPGRTTADSLPGPVTSPSLQNQASLPEQVTVPATPSAAAGPASQPDGHPRA